MYWALSLSREYIAEIIMWITEKLLQMTMKNYRDGMNLDDW